MSRADSRHRFRHSATALIELALLAGAGAAQEGGLASFLDQVEVRVINVDVVVLDASGNPWHGLTREDFELFENGEPVEISNFAAYDATFAPSEPAEPSIESSPPALGEPEPPPPVKWIVYLDLSRLEPGPRNQALRETRDFLSRALRPAEQVMVAAYDGNRLRVMSQLSDDRRAMVSALTDLEHQGSPALAARGRAQQLQSDIVSASTPWTGGAGGSPTVEEAQRAKTAMMAETLKIEVDALAEEEAVATEGAIKGLRDLLTILDGLEGRVEMIFVGGGFDLDPDEALADLWRSRFAGDSTSLGTQNAQLRAGRLISRYQELLEAVNRGRITVHTIFARAQRGLDVSAEQSRSPYGIGAVGTAKGAEGASASLSAFASETGGRSFEGGLRLAERLETVERDLGTYYSLGYQATGEESSDFREIEVRVRREGARILHRTGLSERSADEQAEAAAVGILIRPEQRSDVIATATPGDPRDAPRGRGRVVPVVIRVPLREIALLPIGAEHRGKLVYHFALEEPDGGFLRLEPRRFEFEIPNQELAQALGKAISYEVLLPLAPGRYRLGIAVLDELTGTHVALATPLEMPRER